MTADWDQGNWEMLASCDTSTTTTTTTNKQSVSSLLVIQIGIRKDLDASKELMLVRENSRLRHICPNRKSKQGLE
jgi:hypothetical protein